MKRIIAVLLSVCLLLNILPLFTFAVPMTKEITLDEFAKKLKTIQEKYDNEYAGEIVIKDGESTYDLDGEEVKITDESGKTATAQVNDGEIEIPSSVLEENCVESNSLKKKAKKSASTKDLSDYAEELGFEITVDNETAVLSQPYQTHRLIVKSEFNINTLDSVASVEGYNGLHILQFDDLESTLSALEYYKGLNTVEYVEPDSVMAVCDYEGEAGVSSYGWHQSWGSTYVEYDAFIETLVDTSVSPIDTSNLPQIVVAVVDSGIELTHDFLQGRIIPTGFNVSLSGDSNSENDDHGHGTHVAGIVVDNTTDNVMVSGYKCLDDTGYGPLSSVCACVDKAVEDGVNIINLSLSEEGWSDLMNESVQNAKNHGITVIAAAGNDAVDASTCNPANIDECITVAAMQQTNTGYSMAAFSNWGDVVDIIAPGKTIGSSFLNNSMQSLDGTSMAAPFVAAACALLLSEDTTRTTDDMLAYFTANTKTNWTKPTAVDSIPICLCNCVALHMGTNSGSVEIRTAKPVFSEMCGDYENVVTVTITCPEEAEIYYTTNGRVPTESSKGTLYSGPLTFRKPTGLYAIAVADGKQISLARYAYYKITTTEITEDNFVVNDNGYLTSFIGTSTDITVPEKVRGITVTGIASSAFSSNKNIVNISLPDTVKTIEANAFKSCSDLENVTGNGIISVGNHAFSNCSSLRSLGNPKIISVGEFAFSGCNELADFDFSALTTVKQYAFQNCRLIKSIVNDKLTYINEGAFKNMTALETVDLSNVTGIAQRGFDSCTKLYSVNLPKVASLYGYAFYNCKALESICLPSLKNLYSGYQFSNCSVLKTVDFPEFTGKLQASHAFWSSPVESLNLPKATSITGQYCFKADSLKVLYIPNVVSISSGVFSGSDLESVNCCVFAPKAQTIEALPVRNDLTLYCTEALTALPEEYSGGVAVVAPLGSYGESWAEDNNQDFIDCYSLAASNEETVAVCNDGLRFSYRFPASASDFMLNSYINEISYGFEYTIDGVSYSVEAENVENGYFNLVVSDIPVNKVNETITVQPVINIDGMTFKRVAKSATYSGKMQSNALKKLDSNIDGIINNEDIELITDVSLGLIDPSTLSSNIFQRIDRNGDGVVDGFDISKYDRDLYDYDCFVFTNDNIVSYPTA